MTKPSFKFDLPTIPQAVTDFLNETKAGVQAVVDPPKPLIQESGPNLEEIKQQLSDRASKRDKLEAMKRLLAMISKGRDVSSVFTNVVKNIVYPDSEVKKLVYMYLVHYAEFQQELALLSINSLQMELTNKSPLVRGQALRALSSIRLPLISQILILAIRSCTEDMSPFVRKISAHAIIKAFEIDPAHTSLLIKFITKLLADQSKLVIASAIAAYLEVCPERYDLIHPHYRRYCQILLDINEWGQIYLLNILTRYARHFLANPNEDTNKTLATEKPVKLFFESGSDESSFDEDDDDQPYFREDPDLKLLLNNAIHLLYSRSHSVVLSVCTLLFYCAPKHQTFLIAKPLIRLFFESRVPDVILGNIVTMSRTRPDIFVNYLQRFYVLTTDSLAIRECKLEILINLAAPNTVTPIFAEFNYYLKQQNVEFVKLVVQAIGRVGLQVPEAREGCITALMYSINNPSEIILSESVITLKKIMQTQEANVSRVINYLVQLLPRLTVPNAKASVIWLIGEYSETIARRVPDSIRVLAKMFPNEQLVVKHQILNTACKVLLRSPNDTEILVTLFQYICNMAKFDVAYDLRDRARVLHVLLVSNTTPTLRQHAVQLICPEKPIPDELSSLIERDKFTCGTLSHYAQEYLSGYLAIPKWCEEPSDPSIRDQVIPPPTPAKVTSTADDNESGSESYSESEESSEYDDSSDDEPVRAPVSAPAPVPKSRVDDFFAAFEEPAVVPEPEPSVTVVNDLFTDKPPKTPANETLMNLLDLPSSPIRATEQPGPLLVAPTKTTLTASNVERSKEILVKRVVGKGVEIKSLFLRRSSIQGRTYNVVQLWFDNQTDTDLENLHVEVDREKYNVVPFEPINIVPKHSEASAIINIKFTSHSASVKFDIIHEDHTNPFHIELFPPLGELILPTEYEYSQLLSKFTGMHSFSSVLPATLKPFEYYYAVIQHANVFTLLCNEQEAKFQFSGTTIIDDEPLLISVEQQEDGSFKLLFCCCSAVFATSFHKYLEKKLLAQELSIK